MFENNCQKFARYLAKFMIKNFMVGSFPNIEAAKITQISGASAMACRGDGISRIRNRVAKMVYPGYAKILKFFEIFNKIITNFER